MEDILAVVTDLFFQSRISSAARVTGRRVRYLVRPEDLLGVEAFRLALVDLDARAPVIALIRQLAQLNAGSVVAFGPHLDTEARRAARAAGADRVLAKSKFVTELPRLMSDASDRRSSRA